MNPARVSLGLLMGTVLGVAVVAAACTGNNDDDSGGSSLVCDQLDAVEAAASDLGNGSRDVGKVERALVSLKAIGGEDVATRPTVIQLETAISSAKQALARYMDGYTDGYHFGPPDIAYRAIDRVITASKNLAKALEDECG